MRFKFLRPVLSVAAIVASAGILAGGLALGPAFAVGGSAHVGPFVVTHCTSDSPCQTYGNQGMGVGVQGNNTNASSLGTGVVGSATGGGTGVAGQATTGVGVTGTSSSGYGVTGTSSSSYGVLGSSSTGTAVQGVTIATNGNSGTSGISNGTTGSAHGVYGRSSNGQGVYGQSSSNNGVEGHSTATGGSGVAGIQRGTSSGNGVGVYSESADTTNNYEALEAKADSSTTYIFEGFNNTTNGLCTIDYNAALACTGGADFKNVRTRHLTSLGQHVLAYASESTSATLEDFGVARMVAGVANVAIDPAFGATINRALPYYVFLTPLGDASLYISDESASGFQVRETHGGRSTLSFDYRIVARPLDAMGDRLPIAPAMRQPRS
jgi:hypothetical protein